MSRNPHTLTAIHGGAQPTASGGDDADWADAYSTLIDEGEYLVGFVRAERVTLYGKPRWSVSMRILTEGEHYLKPIKFFIPVIPKGIRPTPGWSMFSVFAIATGRRPPKDLWRTNPRQLLEGCTFVAKVVTSKKDSHNVERPSACWYSRVACLIQLVAGTPPILRREEP